jgi:hypothetical protein
MNRNRVESSSLAAVGYDADREILEVEFRHGAVYQYQGVPLSAFDAFMTAKSLGRHFVVHIRNAYPAVQIE